MCPKVPPPLSLARNAHYMHPVLGVLWCAAVLSATSTRHLMGSIGGSTKVFLCRMKTSSVLRMMLLFMSQSGWLADLWQHSLPKIETLQFFFTTIRRKGSLGPPAWAAPLATRPRISGCRWDEIIRRFFRSRIKSLTEHSAAGVSMMMVSLLRKCRLHCLILFSCFVLVLKNNCRRH